MAVVRRRPIVRRRTASKKVVRRAAPSSKRRPVARRRVTGRTPVRVRKPVTTRKRVSRKTAVRRPVARARPARPVRPARPTGGRARPEAAIDVGRVPFSLILKKGHFTDRQVLRAYYALGPLLKRLAPRLDLAAWNQDGRMLMGSDLPHVLVLRTVVLAETVAYQVLLGRINQAQVDAMEPTWKQYAGEWQRTFTDAQRKAIESEIQKLLKRWDTMQANKILEPLVEAKLKAGQ